MELVAIIGIVLLVVTLVGHGIWVAVAWVLRGGSKKQKAGGGRTVVEDRAAAARYIGHLLSKGVIDEDEHGRLMGLLAAESESMHSVAKYMEIKANRSSVASRVEEAPASPAPPQSLSPPPTCIEDPLQTFATDHASVPECEADDSVEQVEDEVEPVEPFVSQAVPPHSIAVAPLPAAEHRKMGDVLSGFMADRNIRWGELVGGLLIVCCSVALVISLWSRIEAIPVLKFVVFTAMTTGLFGAGLFVHQRWKLPTTGQALLTISTLLAPLNLLAFAAFSLQPSAAGSWALIIEIVAVALFWWLTWRAGRVIAASGPLLFACGVIGLSALALVVRYVEPLTDGLLVGVASVPVGLFVILMGVLLWRQDRSRAVEESEAKEMILQLGVQAFAMLLPLGLLVYRYGDIAGALRLLSPLVCAIASPAMLVGAYIWRRASESISAQTRITATSVAAVSIGIMIVGVVLGWPVPSRIVPAVLVNAFAMVGLVRLVRHSSIHIVAAIWFSVAWVFGVHLAVGELSWSSESTQAAVNTIWSLTTGQGLVGPVVACLLLAGWFTRRKQTGVSGAYAGFAGIVLLASVALLSWFGFGRAELAGQTIWVYMLYCVMGFAAAYRIGRRAYVWVSAGLLQLALIQTLAYAYPVEHLAWPTSLLAGSGICVVAAMVIARLGLSRRVGELYVRPLLLSGLCCSVIAVGLMVPVLSTCPFVALAIRVAIVAALWLVISYELDSPPLFGCAQLALFGAGVITAQHFLARSEWYSGVSSVWYEPLFWQVHAATVSGMAMVWAVGRLVIERLHRRSELIDAEDERPERGSSVLERVCSLLSPGVPTADQLMAGVGIVALVGLSVWGVGPGIVLEHGGRVSAEIMASQVQAAGLGSWLLLVIAVVTLIVELAHSASRTAVAGLLAASFSGALLSAGNVPGEHITGITCYSLAIGLLIVSLAVWFRSVWSGVACRLLRLGSDRTVVWDETLQATLLGMFVLPVMAMTVMFTVAIGGNNIELGGSLSANMVRVFTHVPVALLVVCLIGHGVVLKERRYASVTACLATVLALGVEYAVFDQLGGVNTLGDGVWFVQVGVLILAGIALAWRLVQPLGGDQVELPASPMRPLLVGRVVMGAALLLAGLSLLVFPDSVSPIVAESGTILGIIAVVLLEFAMVTTCKREKPALCTANVRLWGIAVAIVVAGAISSLDTGNWLCYHTVMVASVVTVGLILMAGVWHEKRLLGTGWKEAFDAVTTQRKRSDSGIDHDLSCGSCGYNLRGLDRAGRCPECNSSIADSLGAAASRIETQWQAAFASTRSFTSLAITECVGFATLFVVRAAFDDPQKPWWSVAVAGVLSLLCMALAGFSGRRKISYAAGFELCLAATIWWVACHWQSSSAALIANIVNLVCVNVVAMVIAGGCWLGLVLRDVDADYSRKRFGTWQPLHHAVVSFAVPIVVGVAGYSLYLRVIGEPLVGATLMTWIAWAAVTILALACTKFSPCRHVESGVFLLGLAAAILTISQLRVSNGNIAQVIAVVLGGYTLVVAAAWRIGIRFNRKMILHRGMPASVYGNLAVSVAVLLIAIYSSFAHAETGWRLIATAGPVSCGIAALLLAMGRRRVRMRTWATGLLACGSVLLSWSWIAPDAPVMVLQRSMGVVMALSIVTAAIGLLSSIWQNKRAWIQAFAPTSYGVGVAAGVALIYCLLSELLALINSDPPPLGQTSIIAMTVAMALFAVCLVVFAIRDRFDPLRLSPRWKESYIYAAEWLAGAIALHIRATMPWLFSGFITQYWPMLVMVLAFLAMGASEMCRRYGMRIVARPLGRTGMFLPALVLLELFISSSQVHYSIVLLTSGAFFGVLAGLRRSMTFAVVATISLSGSLWYLLHTIPGLGLAHHPQLWFVPPALVVLAAGHVNRHALSSQQRSTLHYVCLLAVYLSSTADVFLIGVRQAPWLPLVLMGLSVAGIFVGIACRIRSFLTLGTGFLCLSLLAIVWHAATNLGWTWIWYVAGIALGIGIITVFALFEKKRNEMNALIGEIRDWTE